MFVCACLCVSVGRCCTCTWSMHVRVCMQGWLRKTGLTKLPWKSNIPETQGRCFLRPEIGENSQISVCSRALSVSSQLFLSKEGSCSFLSSPLEVLGSEMEGISSPWFFPCKIPVFQLLCVKPRAEIALGSSSSCPFFPPLQLLLGPDLNADPESLSWTDLTSTAKSEWSGN